MIRQKFASLNLVCLTLTLGANTTTPTLSPLHSVLLTMEVEEEKCNPKVAMKLNMNCTICMLATIFFFHGFLNNCKRLNLACDTVPIGGHYNHPLPLAPFTPNLLVMEVEEEEQQAGLENEVEPECNFSHRHRNATPGWPPRT